MPNAVVAYVQAYPSSIYSVVENMTMPIERVDMVRYALLYLHGKGVDRSLIEAKRFLRLAAAQGHQVASEQLAQLERYDSAGAPADPAGLFSSLPVRSYDEVEGATVTNDVTDATVTNDDAVSVLSSHDSITPELVQALSYKAESDVHSKT